MADIRSTFDERKKEILDFIEYIKFLEEKETSLNDDGLSEFSLFFHPSFGNGISLSFQEIVNITKSNLALMIYNLIEFTVANSIDNVYEEIQNANLSYLDVSEKIQIIWRKSILKSVNDPNASFSTFMRKNEEIVNKIVNRQTIYLQSRNTLPAGNLDGSSIKDTLTKHGIGWRSTYYRPQILDKFKQKRNELAHGSVSFIDALRDSTITNIENEACTVIHFLDELLNMVEEYIDNKLYQQQAITTA